MKKWLCFVMLFLVLGIFSTSCASSVVQVRQSEAMFDLYVVVTPSDSLIYIDDELAGTGTTSAETPLKITAGTKRVEIKHEGYHPFRTTLEYIQPGEMYTLTTSLIQSEF